MARKLTYEELELQIKKLEKENFQLKQFQNLANQTKVSQTKPFEVVENIAFEDLFKLDDIQIIQDQFAKATGVASIITRIDGTPITTSSNFCRLCKDIVRKTEKGLKNCIKSDAVFGQFNPDGPIVMPCLGCGLWEAGTGIMVGGKHIANWLIGQVRDESQSEAQIRKYAKEIGANEKDAIEAFHEVTVMSRDQFDQVARLLFTFVNQLSAVAYKNFQHKRFIEELRQAENSLKRSEIFQTKMLANIGDVIVIIDKDGINRFKSPNVTKLFGWKPDELVGSSAWENVHPEDLKSAQNFFLGLMKEAGSIGTTECRYKLKDGSYEWIEFTGNNLFHDPEINGILGNYHCITERKRAEEDLKKSEEQHRQLLKHLNAGVVLHAPDTSVISANEPAAKLLGLSVDQMMGKKGIDSEWCFLRADGSEMPMEEYPVNKVAKTLTPIHEMCLGINRPTTQDLVWVLVNAYPEIASDGQLQRVIVTSLDLTELKQAEEERLKLQAQLTQAQKMESIGRLAGGVAHDFNNMLSVILGYAQAAMDEEGLSETLQNDLGEILNAGNRSADITRQLLAFARKQAIVPKSLNLNNAVESILQMLRRLIGEDIDLIWKPASQIWPVKMDPSQIDQILANLCVNSRDAIHSVGKITIGTEIVSFDQSYCDKHDGFVPGDFVLISASDDGKGMNKETLNNLFEPFFTTKEVGKGTGLGLATVYGIVKQNNGFIYVSSEPEKGSTFNIYLPRYIDSDEEVGIEASEETTLSGQETILVVEDEPAILKMTQMMLAQQGYNVLSADSPAKAITIAENFQGKIHLLITDVVMPEMNGRDLATKIFKVCPDIKLMFVSGYTADVIAPQGVLEEGMNFVQKPFSKQDLTKKVRSVLDEEAQN